VHLKFSGCREYFSDMKEERDNWGNNIGLPPEKYGTVEYERKL
jgi:hypothetical protein